MSIPNAFIQDLIARADVVDVVGKHVQLKKGGANLMGLCPFHSEKSPSFSVSPTKQFYHCFGCGKNGNVISFLMDYLGMNFVEAVEDLAQQMGMQVPQQERSPQEQERAARLKAQQSSLTNLLDKAAHAFKQQLKSSPKAIQYLEGRGLSGKIAARFGLGYAPAGWRFLANVMPDYSAPELVEAGLVIHNPDESTQTPPAQADNANERQQDKRYDRFRDRVMFPIRGIKGDIIGFGGRVLGDEKPKYLNSPETPVFHKGQELYGLYEGREAIREQGYVLVTEGYMDVVALAQLGFANAVATLGTACTADHARKLFRFSDKVVFAFDGDSAGQRAAHKALEATLPFVTDTRSARFLFLPSEHDPDSFIRANGPAAFEAYVQKATPLSRFLLESAAQGADLETTEGRSLMTAQAEPLWSLLPDGAFKRQLLVEISQKAGLSVAALGELWEQKAAAVQARQQRQAATSQPYASGPPHDADGDWGGFGESGAYGGIDPSEPPPQSSAAFASSTEASAGFDTTRSNRTSQWTRGPNGRWIKKAVITQAPLRLPPNGLSDRAVRVLLSNTRHWDLLTHQEHDLLCELPDPHGPLLRWLETEHQDKGSQPWSALQVALQEQAFAPFALRLMNHALLLPDDEQETENQLREVVLQLQLNQLVQQQAQAAQEAGTDPQAIDQYRELGAKIRLLREIMSRQSKA
jgi:DNA primase